MCLSNSFNFHQNNLNLECALCKHSSLKKLYVHIFHDLLTTFVYHISVYKPGVSLSCKIVCSHIWQV